MSSSSAAFLFLLHFPTLQARKPQRVARTRINPTTTGTPKIRKVLVRVGARVGSAVGRDAGSVMRGRAEGGRRAFFTGLAGLGAEGREEVWHLTVTHLPPATKYPPA